MEVHVYTMLFVAGIIMDKIANMGDTGHAASMRSIPWKSPICFGAGLRGIFTLSANTHGLLLRRGVN